MARSYLFLEHPGPLPFAHRGGAAEAVENSWSAFERAIGLGFRYMETDVRATSDGVVVAFHDNDLVRVAHTSGPVEAITWDSLRHITLDDGRPVPRMDELLAAWPEVRWNIDVKAKAAAIPLAEALKKASATQRVLLTSFSDLRCALLRRLVGSGVATGSGRLATAGLVLAKRVNILAKLVVPAPAAAQVPISSSGVVIVDEAFIRVCHQAGIAVHVWTVDDPAEMNRLLDLGVDGLMTDRPTVLKEVLTGRGQWS